MNLAHMMPELLKTNNQGRFDRRLKLRAQGPIFLLFFMLISLAVHGQQVNAPRGRVCNELLTTEFPGLVLRIVNEKTMEPLAARVSIKSEEGKYIGTYYEHLPGIFTNEDGTLRIMLEPGSYEVSVYGGIDFKSCSFTVEVDENRGVQGEVYLEPWMPLEARGWMNIAGHCHLYTERKPDPMMAHRVRTICVAQVVDAVFTAQGWAGYGDDSWKEGFERFSDNKFRLYFGSEMPKYRTGHTWWIGQKSTCDYYDATMDTTYENQYYQVAREEVWNFNERPFPNVPDVEVVQRIKQRDGALDVRAHPTSWWWQERGTIEKYTTNVPAYLSYGLLAGQIWDATVVMGYDHDHYFYQNLWFHILNQGYRMPGLAELDGGFERNSRFYYGSMRTYVQTGGSMKEEDVIEAIKKGRVIVTSGPMVFLDYADSTAIGKTFPADSTKKVFQLEAYASGDREDYLSYIVLYRNGRISRLWDLREERPRVFRRTLEVFESETAWYVVKAYGRKAWNDPKYLDIVKYASDTLINELPPSGGDAHDVCLTNPVYFHSHEKEETKLLEANVTLKLLHPGGARPVKTAMIHVMEYGRSVREIAVDSGLATFTLPLHASIMIKAEGYPEIRRSLYLDYLPHLKLLEHLGNGEWRAEGNNRVFVPGQVPWSAFKYRETKDLLSDIEWSITVEENIRDQHWREFDQKFDNE